MKERYKYLWRATVEAKVGGLLILKATLSIVSLWLNAKVLQWIQLAIDNYQNPIHYINLIIIECIIVTIIQSLPFVKLMMAKIYTVMLNMLTVKVTECDYSMFVEKSPGELESTANGIHKACKLPSNILDAIYNATSVIINLSIILMVDVKVGILVGVIYIIGASIVYPLINKWDVYDGQFDSVKHERDRLLDEAINGFAELRSFKGTAKRSQEQVINKTGECSKILRKRANIDCVISAIIDSVDSIGTIAILSYAILGLTTGSISSSTKGLTLVMYTWRLVTPVMNLVELLSSISECSAPLPKFNAVIDYENKVLDGNIELKSFENDITFNNVGFSYKDSDNVLNNVSFTVKKGGHIGICGSSGGGKSTLLKLIPRFYDVIDGSIKIDGIDLRDLTKESLRGHIGIVHQDTFIFDGTIADNVRYGKVGYVSDNEIIEACKKASIYDFIMNLPDGFNTKVGPRGLKLSGGQKQRIAIARLFITQPDIIILDEATSALDNETEQIIQESLAAFKDKTMIVVAHRLSTIKDSDKIIVIDNHKVAEQGTHDELIKLGKIYAELNR